MPQLKRQVPDGAIIPGLNSSVSDIAAKRIVKGDAANGEHGVALSTAATDKFRGITMETLVAGRLGDVQKAGMGILTAGGVVAIGDRITSDGSGKGIATTTEDNTVIGEARTAATGDGVDFQIELMVGTHVP
jgi:Uncharacterized conserved protein (DUF2190)